MEYLSVLEQAANSFLTNSDLPSPAVVVDALLVAERQGRKTKSYGSFEQLIGTWQLCLITGTRKTRQKAGIVLGAGRYIPKFIQIKLTYFLTQEKERVNNCIVCGGLTLSLTGPVKFLPQKNLLAFDFTQMRIKIFGLKLYQGYIRSGKLREQKFEQEKINQQAFFAYFLIEEQIIAARGRGGGLALWDRLN
ncbi:hypothetical protein IQ238_04865 [Pleurocapsales cyanobacterium LEGE 06147]|nr:hypothetical protein [Pleurocapsales cyanobacterium LEGE 06147]